MTGIVDGNGNQTGLDLDAWGRLMKIQAADGGMEGYTYDHAGNITSTTDANGEPSITVITARERSVRSRIRKV